MSAQSERLERVTSTVAELYERHQEHERRLAELSNKAWLTPDEELEEKRLKKLKLQLKDQMARLRSSAS